MRAILTVEENGVERRYELTGTVLVGREGDCQVHLDDPTVSRRHATIAPAEGGFVLRDLSSGSGTYLDGTPVQEAFVVPGERIRFGAVAARIEEEADQELSASRKLRETLTQTLSIKPARSTRLKAVLITVLTAVLVLLSATAYHRHARQHAPSPTPPTQRPA